MIFSKPSAEKGGGGRCAALICGAVLLTAFLLFVLFGGGEKETVTTFAMGSFVKQTLYGGGEQAASAAAAAVTELENRISWRVEGSEIELLNRSAAEGPSGPVSVSAGTGELLALCEKIAADSGGAFDPTIAPVSRLWDFDGEPHVPSPEELDEALKRVGQEGLLLKAVEDGRCQALLDRGCSLDLGAVGKGAACDAVLKSWKESGVSRGVVAVGGSVGLCLEKPFYRAWNVAIRDPGEPLASASLGILRLREGCVSTSGNYEKTFTENGTIYHHLLDPKTGYPAESGLVSVTVWANVRDGQDGARSDALSTACFVLGYEKSLPLLRDCSAEAVFVTADRRVIVTEGLASAFTLTSDSYTMAEEGGS